MHRRIGMFIAILAFLILMFAVSTATALTTPTTVFLPDVNKEATPTPTLTPTVTATATPTPPVTYSDDFSNSNSGWPNTDDSVSRLDYLNGEYQILVKQSGYFVRAYHNLDARDFHVQVDTRVLGDANVAYGLYFGYNNGNYYAYQIEQGEFSLERYDSGAKSWVILINWTPSAAIAGGSATNHLMVTRSGTTISLFANGSQLAQVSDGFLGEGFVGMASGSYAANTDVRFDNFSLVGVIPLNVRSADKKVGTLDDLNQAVRMPENQRK